MKMPKNIRKDTHQTRKPFSHNWKQQKDFLKKTFSSKFFPVEKGRSFSQLLRKLSSVPQDQKYSMRLPLGFGKAYFQQKHSESNSCKKLSKLYLCKH